jgi:hypothetical protein
VEDLQISDDELAALALAADPDGALEPDAIPMYEYLGRIDTEGPAAGLLPDWYMAPVRTSRIRRGPQLIVLLLIGSFLMIEAFGLCSTYGQPLFH